MRLFEEFAKRVQQLEIDYAIDTVAVLLDEANTLKLVEGQSCALLAKEIYKSKVLERIDSTDTKTGTEHYRSRLLVIRPDDYMWLIRELKKVKEVANAQT